jgi:DNA (cytosine-5)-methyltransferase 1
MNFLSLFSGIGGMDLGLERAGMRCVGQAEIDPFCRRVLAKHWPEVPRHDDVRTCPEWWASEPRPRLDVVAGGFPCQPVSQAGRRLAQQDERWLWPAMARVVAVVRPTWVVVENVPGLLHRGIGDVAAELSRLGYAARPGLVSACTLGAPHPRDRLFILAHAVSPGRCAWRVRGSGAVAADGELLTGGGSQRCGWWAAEPDVDRVAYGVPRGVDRRRALGNAVVPQVAEVIGRMVMGGTLSV